MVKITLKEQECTGTYKFNGQILYTKGIEAEFGNLVFKLIADTFKLLKPLLDANTADYLQVVEVERKNGDMITVWVIDDVTHITFLLPSEY